MKSFRGDNMKKYIIDLSQYNTVSDFPLMLDNVSGVILRIGYRGYGSSGKLVQDKKFDTYVKQVITSGIPWGVYFVDQAINSEEAKGQAIFINSILKKYDISNMILGIWCDSEKSGGRGDKLSRLDRTQYILSMLDKLSSLGYKNGIYASNSWLNDMLVYSAISNRFIWNASYGKNAGTQGNLPSRRHDLHQFTSNGTIQGIKGKCDLSSLENQNFAAVNLTVSEPKSKVSENPYEKPSNKEAFTRKNILFNNKEHVKWLQWNLIKYGFLASVNKYGNSNIDGWYGADTESAVVAFQESKKIKADGKAGIVTNNSF